MKNCYICIPIAGRENDVFERANIAKEELKKNGLNPINPLDLNNIGNKELENHTQRDMIAWYMGRDIQMIIKNCDAIYCCEGWQNSKGCNVELECAKQYGLDIYFQKDEDVEIYKQMNTSFIDMINDGRRHLVWEYCDLAQKDPNTQECSDKLNEINIYEEFIQKYFNVKYDKENYIFKMK